MASGYHIEQHWCGTFPSSQEILLESNSLEAKVEMQESMCMTPDGEKQKWCSDENVNKPHAQGEAADLCKTVKLP